MIGWTLENSQLRLTVRGYGRDFKTQVVNVHKSRAFGLIPAVLRNGKLWSVRRHSHKAFPKQVQHRPECNQV